MTTPAQAAVCMAWALALGAGLGVVYGFLRPLRPRWTLLTDLVFVLAALYAWLFLGFAVCRGEIRLAGTGGLLAGCLAWELSLGRLLRPVFSGFWRVVGGGLRMIWLPFEKIMKFFRKNTKNYLHSGKNGLQ